VAGRPPPGLRLTEAELAARLVTSRVPVREALQDLARDGWIDLLPRRGARVHTPHVSEVDNVFAVRAALESERARIAARVATPIDVEKKLRHLVTVGSALAQASDERGASQANSDFHRQIAEITRNDLLTQILKTLETRIRWYFSQVAAVCGMNSWLEHERIVDAISCADDELAAEEARKQYRVHPGDLSRFLGRGARVNSMETLKYAGAAWS